ncbi:KRI1-like family-domain-containing protein [Xylariales sp. PMI_506]|nr:KRI1-like family-domain-containing protein [Xylariales sp. PMI_506]
MAPDIAKKKPQPALFDDSEDESDGGANLKINEEFAKRFEHNKKREERHRLEEKYKAMGKKPPGEDEDEDDDDSSDDETEDEDGYLATEELDAQLNATLEAIRKKDPRIYDGKSTFYQPEEAATGEQPKTKKEKPIFLQDYHRERIMAGDAGIDDEVEAPKTYAEEQSNLQNSIRDEIQAQLRAEAGEESEEDDGFIKPKKGEVERVKAELQAGMHPSRANQLNSGKSGKSGKSAKSVDVAVADKDPELFLSNFMASRAWIEPDSANWKAFESDDEDINDQADEWEAAYNLRFEDPSKSNEVLRSYARDVAAAKSVRREEKTGRKKQRELERERKEAEKQERREERARLRKLKLDEAETKLKQIKKAAGISGKAIKEEDWVKFLNDAWENDRWEEEMNKTFGDQYYAEGEGAASEDEDEDGAAGDRKKVKKPKWDDDIDIKDLVPDFEDEEKPQISLSELEADEEEVGDEDEDEDDEDAPATKRQKTAKDRKKERLASQKEARRERAQLEALVDAKMDIDNPAALAASSSSSKPHDKDIPKFAYRETWAESYGLTARDILMAPSDAALNEFVGLKKLAHFRPQDKRSKDKKRLSKKARLRQWRRETFGAEAEKEGPAFAFGGSGAAVEDKSAGATAVEGDSNIIEGSSKKRKKRSGRKGKGPAAADE